MIATALPLLVANAALAADADSPVPAPQPYGLVQAWLTVYDMDEDPVADPAGYGDPEDDPGVKLRRARLGFDGQGKGVRYGVVFGMASPYDQLHSEGSTRADLVDAYVGYRPVQGLWISGGVLKVPLFREMLVSAEQLTFTERAVSTEWMSPGRDAGVVIDYRTRDEDEGTMGRVRIGGFNGNGSALGDDNAGKLFSARAEFNYGPGSTYRTWGEVDGFTFGVAGDFWLDQGPSTKTMGYGGDAIARVGGLAVMADVHLATLKPVDSPVELPGTLTETPRFGASAQVGYSVGAFEPAVRFSLFDDDRDVDDNGDVGEGTFGLTWHGKGDVVRAGAGYVLRLERGGEAASNDTARLWMQLKL